MKTNLLAFLFFSIGILLYVVLNDNSTDFDLKEEYTINPSDLKSIDTGIYFLDIFLNNIIVGLMLSYLGFFTGGILTAVLLILWTCPKRKYMERKKND